MKRLILGLAVTVALTSPTLAQDKPIGWNTGVGGNIPLDAPVITTSLQPTLTAERNLSVVSADSAFLQWVDNGANAAFELDFGICPLTNGGTGGATAQAGTNNLLDGCAGSAAASGDIFYRNGSTWTRLAKGTDGDALILASGLPGWSPLLGASTLAYVTIGNTGSLSGERALTGTANRITFSDGGANGPVTADIGSDVVTLTGTQTLTNKLLTSPSIDTNLKFELGANDVTISATAPAASRSHTIPDVADASFVMTEGAQTINGVKTMGSATRFNAEIQNSSGNTITLPTSAATLSTLALPESLTNKTLPSSILQTQLTLDAATADYTITWANPSGARAYSVPDVGGSANFGMTSGTMTAGGVAYGDGNKIQVTSAITSGYLVQGNGASAPSEVNPNLLPIGVVNGYRLTLTSATPVTTSDVTAAGTLYCTPYKSKYISLWNSGASTYQIIASSEKSLALSVSSGTNYDVFGYISSGDLAIETTAWSTDTARATGLTRDSFGVLHKTGDQTRRYLGTIRASGSNTCEDSAAKRYVWNNDNRVMRSMRCADTTNSYTYTTATTREINGGSTEGTSRVGFVRGVDEDSVSAHYIHSVSNTGSGVAVYIGVGLDTSTAMTSTTAGNSAFLQTPAVNVICSGSATYNALPGIGYHTLRCLEYSNASGTTTWYGDNGTSLFQTGMTARGLF